MGIYNAQTYVASLGLLKAQGQSVYITIEKQSHIITHMRHYKMGL